MSNLGSIDNSLLIFGGPYSNYAATAAMKARTQQLGITPDRVICTGDVIAYCAEPAQTLDLVRDWGIQVVMGNCEESLANGEDDCGCGFEEGSECSVLAVTWYEFANRLVSTEQRHWMRELPRAIDFCMSNVQVRMVHGSLDSINEFVFASQEYRHRLLQMREYGLDVVVGGHCGIPFAQRMGERYWLNAGVIGMPANDGGQHGWYMLMQPREAGIDVSWHRLDYDHQESSRTTIEAGMPAYGRALVDGLWPNTDILPDVETLATGKALELPSLLIETDSAVTTAKAV